jgi:hypothetical protein
MIQRRRQRRLAQQPIKRIVLTGGSEHEEAAKDFERNIAAEPSVACAIDLSHAACAELPQHFIGADLGS